MVYGRVARSWPIRVEDPIQIFQYCAEALCRLPCIEGIKLSMRNQPSQFYFNLEFGLLYLFSDSHLVVFFLVKTIINIGAVVCYDI